MNGTTINRYPGPSPYEDTPEHHCLFSGRDPEIRFLTDQIIACRLTVVFGQSGLGKTSLLQAGVFRKLREEELFPVSLRLNNSVSPVELIIRSCETASRECGIDYVPGTMCTAWEFFKTAMFWRGGTLVSPVVVFDQFEEIFTLIDSAWRRKFSQEIGPLVSGNAPPAARERLRGGDSRINDMPPKMKIVFSLREEWYGSLEELSFDIPGLFQNRFQLLPLPISQAKQAIDCPARAVLDGSVVFSTLPFRYDPSASQMMVDFLKGNFERIEPFQLQLLCQDVEQRIVRAREQQMEAGGAQASVVIMPEDLGGELAMAVVLRRFYQGSLNALPLQQRFRAQELCDTGLLSPAGHRLMLQADQIRREFGVTATTLKDLVKKRILREVPRLESIFYEISHDRLAQSILKARRRRIPRKYRVPAVVVAAVVFAFFIYVAVSIIKLDNERTRANNERDQADQARARANYTRERAEELASYLIGEDLMGSIRPIGRLDVMEGVEKRVDRYLAQVASQHEEKRSDLALQIEGLAHLNRGDLAYQQFELTKAKNEYLQAQDLFKRLSKQKSTSAEWWHSLADADAKLAGIARDQLRMADSLVLCKDAQTAIEKSKAALRVDLTKAHQSDREDKLAERLLRDQADIHKQMADILASQGKLTDALGHYDQTLRIASRIAKSSADATPWLYVLQDGLLGKGTILSRQGKNQAAEAAFKAALMNANRALTMSPFEPRAQYKVAIARNKVANLSFYQKPAQVIPEYEEVRRTMKEMTNWDPRNKRWGREYAAALILVGDGYRQSNDQDRALSFYEDAQRRLSELRGIDDTNHELEMDFVWLNKGLADSLSKTSAAQNAVARYDDALKILGKLGEIDPTDYDLYKEWIYAASWKAQALNNRLDYDKTVDACMQSFLVLKRIKTIDSTDTEYWETVSILHSSMGDALLGKKDYPGAEREYTEAVNAIKRATDKAVSNAEYWNDASYFYSELARVRDDRDDQDGALKAGREQVRMAERAVEMDPANAEYDFDFARASMKVGDRLRKRHEFAEAATFYASSEGGIREAITKADKKDAGTYRDNLIELLRDHTAPLRVEQKDKTGMLKAYEQAVAVRQSEVASEPNNASAHSKLATAYEDIGDKLRKNGELLAALESYTHAEAAFRDAIAQADKKDAAEYRDGLVALLCSHLADLRAEQKDKTRMFEAYEAAIAVRQSEVASQPNNASVHSKLAAVHRGIADELQKNGELVTALDLYARAEQALHETIALADKKDAHTYQDDLVDDVAREYLEIGDTFRDQGDLTKAQESYERSDQTLSYVIGLDPSNAAYWDDRYVLYDHSMAPLRMKQGQHAAALDTYQQALQAITKAAELNATRVEYHYYIGLAHEHIADVIGDQGQAFQALQSYDAAEQKFMQAIGLTKNDPKATAGYWNELCVMLMKAASLRAGKGDQAGAKQAYIKAQEAIVTAVTLNPEESSYRTTRSALETKLRAMKPD